MSTASPTRFGELLRRYRLVAGLSQESLAERAGLSARGISDLERGARAFPRAETVGVLADALGLSPAARAELAAAARPGATPLPGAPPGVSTGGALPRGTVAFLFTDVEGSTAHWERDPVAMRAAIERHFRLLGDAVEAHGGVLYNAVGDAGQAAFPGPGAAIAATLDAQRAFMAEPWGEAGPLRVRVALHAAEAEPQGGRYLEPALNLLGRLLAAGHGGQVLVTEAARQLAGDRLPAGAMLTDLGEHRLRDLPAPERVFQLTHPELPPNFPPLRTPHARTAHLPVPPTPLIGREAEVATVADLLARPEVRLVTLTGAGGVGKTRLALAVATQLAPDFPDGAAFVDLAPVREPNLVASAVARALDVREAGDRPVAAALAAALRDRRLLLVLDNFEHVLGAAPLVAEVLAAGAGLKILVTSRSRLRLRGERERIVPPLTLPDRGTIPTGEPAAAVDRVATDRTTAALAENPAVRLFVERVQDVRPDVALTNENASVVAEICRRLDGLPLALELAAAWAKVLSMPDLLARIEPRRLALAGGPRDLPPRQQTIRGTIAWSHDLLSADQQVLFRRLAVFAGGFTLDAAEAVAAGGGPATARGPSASPDPGEAPDADTLDFLSALADQSLVRREEPGPRFGMFETIREYALERLRGAGEENTVRAAHLAHFLALAERGEAELVGPRQAEWMRRLATEHDNLRAALGWTIERGDADHALRLGAALWRFWARCGRLREGRDWLERALSLPEGADREARARALQRLGNLAVDLAEYPRARELYEASLAIWRDLDDARAAHALNNLGVVAWNQGDYGSARSALSSALTLYRAREDKLAIAAIHQAHGFVALAEGKLEEARAESLEALALRREQADAAGIAYSCLYLAQIGRQEGQTSEAERLLRESLLGFRQVGDQLGVASVLDELGRLAYAEGRNHEALDNHRQALALRQDFGDVRGIVESVEGIAATAIAQGRLEQGVTLLGAAARWRTERGAPLSIPVRAEYDRTLATARRDLDGGLYARAWATGQALTVDQAIGRAGLMVSEAYLEDRTTADGS